LQKINASGQIGTIGDYAFAGQTLLNAGVAGAIVANQNGTITTVASGVQQAIRDALGMKNLDIAGLTFIFTDNQAQLIYDPVTDTLTLPNVADSATLPDWVKSGKVVLSLTTNSTDTGRYGVENLRLDLNRWVTDDVAIPSNLSRDPGMIGMLQGMHADKAWGITDRVGNTQVVVTVPVVSGYTANKKTITATVNPNGTITPNEDVLYTPDLTPGGGGHDTGTPTGPTQPGDTTGGTTDPSTPVTPVTPVNPGNTPGGDPAVTPTTPVITPTTGGDEAIPYPPDFDGSNSQTGTRGNAQRTVTITPKLAVTGPNWQLKRVVPRHLLTTVIQQQTLTRTSVTTSAYVVGSPIKAGHFTRDGQPATGNPQAAVPSQATVTQQQSLPQTNEQSTGWQWLGTILLAGLSWLGLAHKRNHN